MLASQQVLQRIVQLLVAANTGSGVRVFSDRFHPVAQFPTTRVLLGDEDMQADDDGDSITWPREQLHRLQIDVQVLVQAASGLDAAMAEAELQVVQALQGSVAAATLQPLQGCVLRVQGARREATQGDQAAHGITTLRCEALFRTFSNNPETFI